jgi:nucleoside-diphosphate-sugar epimerase
LGQVNRILITGANGFVGQACVQEARARGLEVVAVYRSAPLRAWVLDEGILPQQADLSDASSVAKLGEALHGVQSVIHAAAHLGDSAVALHEDTITGTKTLLHAMEGSAAHLVLVSSISVYDNSQIPMGSSLTEDSPLIPGNAGEWGYGAAKRAQEDLCRGAPHPLWILRPGAIYGPGRSWHALLGVLTKGVQCTASSEGELPIAEVGNVAQALVSAALRTPEGCEVLNVFDDARPTRSEYVAQHRRLAGWPRVAINLPLRLWYGVAYLLSPFGPRLPQLFQRRGLDQRVKALRHPNTALRMRLGGEDRGTFAVQLKQAIEGGHGH